MTTNDITSLPDQSNGVTITTMEIAERTGKRHDNVMRDTRSVLVTLYGEGGLLRFEDTHVNPQNGQSYPIFRLPKREAMILVSGYSVELRAKIVDRLDELEAEKRAVVLDLNSPTALRGILLSYTEKVIALEAKVDALEPKADALDRLATADGSLCVTDAAKTLQLRPQDLFKYLRQHSWIYKRAGTDHDVAYQSKLVSGVLEHKTTTVHRADGSEKVTTQVRVTPKGLTVLAKLFPAMAEVA